MKNQRFLIGIDGGGSGTRVRITTFNSEIIGKGQGGPSALLFGVESSWDIILKTCRDAFLSAGLIMPTFEELAIGIGLAGCHNPYWMDAFRAANPGISNLALASDATTSVLGAHGGQAGAVIALGTGSVGEALLPDGSRLEVSGWGFPAGDEASGAWLGIKAIAHAQKVGDGRHPPCEFASAVIAFCEQGSNVSVRAVLMDWVGKANQTSYARLAPLVIEYAEKNSTARNLMEQAAQEVCELANALDPEANLPLALCGGLAKPISKYLPINLLARCRTPLGDSVDGALLLIRRHLGIIN